MRMATLSEAQERLSDLVRDAQGQVVGLTDQDGNLVGLLAGVAEDDLDDLVAETEGFKAMIARSRASRQSGRSVPVEELLEEARSELSQQGGGGM